MNKNKISTRPPFALGTEAVKHNWLERHYADDSFVDAPNRIPSVSDELAVTFMALTEVLRVGFANDRKYPNVRLSPHYSPTHARLDTVDFMLAWGKATQYPGQFKESLPDLFGKTRIAVAAKRRKTLFCQSMNAHGVIGRLGIIEDQPLVVIASKSEGLTGVKTQTHEFDESLTDTHVDLISGIVLATPLRFNSALRYRPHDNYSILDFAPDDESCRSMLHTAIKPIYDKE